ncbi:MAG: DtxR family transcriptional regulator [Thermoplasmata archaeon]
MRTEQADEYLELLYKLTKNGEPAKTTQISKGLGLAPASVTEMLQRLAKRGYVKHEPYKGATLTRKGMMEGRRLARRHRLLERFLHDVLKIRKDKVHEEACRLEHAISPETEDAICRHLRHPAECPDDGSPIPPCEKDVFTCVECMEEAKKRPRKGADLVPLASLPEGSKSKVAFIRAGKALTRRLCEMGFTKDTMVRVLRKSRRGPMQLDLKGYNIAIGWGVAQKIFVQAG